MDEEVHVAGLDGRVALVTGGASGLGRATCVALAAQGVHVVAGDIDEAGAQVTVEAVTSAGGSAEAVRLDVTVADDRTGVVGSLFERHGARFDILVNVAGIDRPGYLTDVDESAYSQVFAVNCHGPVFLMQAFLNGYLGVRTEDTEAEIFNVISISAVTVGSGAVAYNSSKAAFAKATEIFQTEVREFSHPCRIQGIMPAAMDTPMMEQWKIPAERMMDPSEVAAEIVHALGRPRGVLGQNLIFTPRVEYFPR
ncbi:NAD(P)-dependent dehydrogenase, short-chain alcohol dehydrogenase family [Friedmanniella luteola]|uniref:NAD(P)-dependent dehydrogenase, short-chain alcohol dehydrogenase family n=1 Tax=Friedmanniella luteola TaxID=546871 RepID=A0A1H1YYF8_9ACTN|nr:NAD(P)-dependent dehydrogenase, short-chain alcohol dehydrogenase family [Friedmanniella luteola]